MTQIDFLRTIEQIRNSCGLDCSGPNYYVFIHKDLRRATVNHTGYISMSDVACVLVVCAYNWKNMGYVNTSLIQLAMVDQSFQPIEKIQFGKWNFKGLQFTRFYGEYYNAWRPIPILELSTDSSVNNLLSQPYVGPEPFPEWEWPNVDVKQMTEILKSINEFAETYSK